MRKRLELKGILNDPKDEELVQAIEDEAKELCEYVIKERGKDISYYDLECLVMRTVYTTFMSMVLDDAYEEIKNNAKGS